MQKKGSIYSHIARAMYFETHSMHPNSVHYMYELKIIPGKNLLFYSNSLSNIITFDF